MLELNRGYTLLEIMVTLGIVAVVASLAAPAFDNVIEKQRVRSAADNLMASISLARSEAITRNTTVTVQGADPDGDTTLDWNDGWQIRLGATSLREEDAPAGVTLTETGSVNSFQFNNSGRASSAVSFQIVPNGGSTAFQRCVSLSLSGKPRGKEGGC